MSSDTPQKWALHFPMYSSRSSSVFTSTGGMPVIFVKRSTSRRGEADGVAKADHLDLTSSAAQRPRIPTSQALL